MTWSSLLLLAVSWLPLVGYFEPRDPGLALRLGLGSLLLVALPVVLTSLRHRRISWPQIAAAASFFVAVCGTQSLVFLACQYVRLEAGLTRQLAELANQVAPLLGMDTTAADGLLLVQTNQHVLAISITAEKLGMPAITVFWASGLVALWLTADRNRRSWKLPLRFSGLLLGYALLRLVVVTLLHRDYDHLELYWSTKWFVFSHLPLVGLLSILAPLQSVPHTRESTAVQKSTLGFSYLALTAFSLVALHSLRLPNSRPDGRVLIDERHSDWAWTQIPFTKTSYTRQATYSYSNLLTHLRRYYDVDVNQARRIDDRLLDGVDVLVIKTPTESFLADEVDAIERFVDAGGGLFLIGDHTNLFGMTTNINPLATRFGLRFENDDTFVLGSGKTSEFRVGPFNTHPVAQQIGSFEFETSCTLRTVFSAEPVMVGYGLGSEQVDYGHVNFFGNMAADVEDSYGSFLQAAAVEYGRGRVFAFTDSTVMSNFSLFKPGHSELMLAAIEYLRAGARPWFVRYGVVLLGAAILVGSWWLTQRQLARWSPAVVFGGLAAGVLAATSVIKVVHENIHQLPPLPRDVRTVTFESGLSNFRLPSMVEYQSPDAEKAYSAFFVNTQRLNLVPQVRSDLSEALTKTDPIVFLNPLGAVRAEDARRVSQFVDGGGRLLVMVPSAGPFFSTSALLNDFAISVSHSRGEAVEVRGMDPVAVPARLEIDPERMPRIYHRAFGRGRVVVVVGSEYFSKVHLGPSFNAPDDEQRPLYELQYYLFEELLLSEWEGATTQLLASVATERDGFVQLDAAGPRAPAFQLPSIDGTALALSDLSGSVVVVNFWATWCKACLVEMPTLQALRERLDDEALQIVAISVDDALPIVADYARASSYDFRFLWDGNKSTAQAYGVNLYPHSVVIDKNGTIVDSISGVTDWSSAEKVSFLSHLLAAPRSDSTKGGKESPQRRVGAAVT